jgi:hypothetical protein
MDIHSSKIVQAYVLNIAQREMRQYFGRVPYLSGNIPDGAKDDWNWHGRDPGNWIVELTIIDDGVKINTNVEFNVHKVTVSVAAYPTLSENGREQHGGIDKQVFHVADPKSRDDIEEFFTKTIKKVKSKLWGLKLINRTLADKRKREHEELKTAKDFNTIDFRKAKYRPRKKKHV